MFTIYCIVPSCGDDPNDIGEKPHKRKKGDAKIPIRVSSSSNFNSQFSYLSFAFNYCYFTIFSRSYLILRILTIECCCRYHQLHFRVTQRVSHQLYGFSRMRFVQLAGTTLLNYGIYSKLLRKHPLYEALYYRKIFKDASFFIFFKLSFIVLFEMCELSVFCLLYL